MAIPRQLDALLETMYRLEENGIELLGFTGGTSLAPTITAAAHPMLYTLFKDTIRKGYRQDGVRRREAWEARNPVNGVIVRWEEVVCGG
ncbi:MAG: hypothetical protein LBS70_09890 [Candidatus Accumulibacter sp.]|nr:hypothetical protein [Accumulibacter sp.]